MSKKKVVAIENRIKKKMIIGIDQSYTKTGISIEVSHGKDSKTIIHKTLDFNYMNKSQARKVFKEYLRNLIINISVKGYKKYIIVERIRMFSKGGISLNYIVATGGLLATIYDIAYEFGIPVYSVDTRSWKSQIVGTSKPDINGDKKKPTMDFVKSLGIKFNSDDEADAICIAKYGFLPTANQKLNLESDENE